MTDFTYSTKVLESLSSVDFCRPNVFVPQYALLIQIKHYKLDIIIWMSTLTKRFLRQKTMDPFVGKASFLLTLNFSNSNFKPTLLAHTNLN